MSRMNFFQKRGTVSLPDSHIQGFDIELNPENRQRIDRLVDHYEKSIVSHLDEAYHQKTSWADRLADRMAAFGGSWTFIVYFAVFLVVWVGWNSTPFTRSHFDAPPFILLNLCLSFIAAFQAPVIMMSQNRQAARDKHESIIDFAINYKAEQEIDDMQSHLHRIESELIEVKKLLADVTNPHSQTNRKVPDYRHHSVPRRRHTSRRSHR